MEIIPFLFEDRNEIRTIRDENGNIWFVAKDVLICLLDNNNPNVGEATKDLDDDEKNTIILNDGNKGNPNTLIVSESGLYSLIIRSRKPVAKPFQKWVTREVLPSIRKTGNYSISQTQISQNLQIPEIGNSAQKMIELDNNFTATTNLLANLRNANPIDLFRLDQFFKKTHHFSILQHFEIDLENRFFLPTELGRMINTSPVEINLMIAHKGFQIKKNGVWKITSSGRDFGIEIIGKFSQIKWKMKAIL